jgi:hypothetical protein
VENIVADFKIKLEVEMKRDRTKSIEDLARAIREIGRQHRIEKQPNDVFRALARAIASTRGFESNREILLKIFNRAFSKKSL